MSEFSRDDSSIVEIQMRAANLRIAKIKAEKEFIDVIGKEVSPEEVAELKKRRQTILYQLEMEGAEIERDFIEKYRSKLAGLVIRYPGMGLENALGCPFCDQCVTSCKECVTSCTGCVGCTNNVF
jgi:hypothetical protein